MGPGFPSEQLSFAYNSAPNPNDTGHDYPAYELQSDFLPSNFQSNGMNVSPSIPLPCSHQPQLEFDPRDGFKYSFIQPQSVPNTPNNQSQFNPQPRFPPNDLSHTQGYDQGQLDTGTTAGWGGPSLQIEQGATMDHLGHQGALFSSASQGSSSQMTIGHAFSPSDELRSQSRVQDYPPDVRPFPPRQVQDVAQSHVMTHGQNAATQTTQQREQKAREKKEKDRINKRGHRSRNAQDYERICALLDIPLKPKNSLAHRILEAVQGLVENQVDSDLRDQLKEKEAEIAYLKMECSKDLTEADTGPTHTALGGLDTCETLYPWL